MAAADPARRRLSASIAANASWARTPIRSERTAAARRSSPGSVEYWLAEVDPDERMSPDDRRKAAVNARRAYMAGLRLKGLRKTATKS